MVRVSKIVPLTKEQKEERRQNLLERNRRAANKHGQHKKERILYGHNPPKLSEITSTVSSRPLLACPQLG